MTRNTVKCSYLNERLTSHLHPSSTLVLHPVEVKILFESPLRRGKNPDYVSMMALTFFIYAQLAMFKLALVATDIEERRLGTGKFSVRPTHRHPTPSPRTAAPKGFFPAHNHTYFIKRLRPRSREARYGFEAIKVGRLRYKGVDMMLNVALDSGVRLGWIPDDVKLRGRS
ncbi:unnamed protein product [Cyclocybe aegerita]|uniref:Uncharacterized protein n=1 Tax=Cyclocybe aegerita TaxID=1973307 RepID=A0A8S0VZD2_CYCAE|nr:unnamed protein product [Cyclocybe aegerita]